MNPTTVELERNEMTGETYLVFRNQGVIDQTVPVDLGLMVHLRELTNHFIELASQRIMADSFNPEANE